MPAPWSTLMKRSAPMLPAKETTPEPTDTTLVPSAVAISIPRWPEPYGESGGSKPRVTGPATGHVHESTAEAKAAGADTTAGTDVVRGTTTSVDVRSMATSHRRGRTLRGSSGRLRDDRHAE